MTRACSSRAQRQKAIVTPHWLRDSISQHSVLPCGSYAALHESIEETVHNCPEGESSTELSSPTFVESSGAQTSEAPTSRTVKLNYMSRYACQRASPLVCPNQTLVGELDVLRHSRELEGLDINALGYARAIAVR